MTTAIVASVAALALAGLGWLGWKHVALRRRFAPVLDIDAELGRVQGELEKAAAAQTQFLDNDKRRREQLTESYTAAKTTFERLQREVALLEENLEDISFGLYKPHYDFATSVLYKARLDEIYEDQKDLIRSGGAVRIAVEWSVHGSRKEGARMQKQYSKLMLRAFNGECDAATAKVTWNNVTRMEERIQKAFSAINELGGVMQISLDSRYLELRVQELRLTWELEEKKRAEAEEQRRIREQMREEERAQRELEKAQKEAEAEEVRYEKALEKARAETARATGKELEALNARVAELQQRLAEAHAAKERAISQAQLTKSGHVYIVSNVGSFGENTFKIGMTRRLEPLERIKELGDASVPFEFDVHGMIYSEDAPGLESALHQQFDRRRVNLVNPRKEFFNVTLQDIEEFVRARQLKVELTRLAEAREYRETLALKQRTAAQPALEVQIGEAVAYPAELFAKVE